jgi:predicted small secreted protein
MKQATIAAILISLSLLLKSCNTTEPPDNGNGQDTTSHNFTFQSWTFGEHSSSVLYDVAIINENNIWAVGEIYLNDSLGQSDPQPYGVAHWDGTDWMLMKVSYHDFNQTEKYPGPLFTVTEIDGEIYVVSYANLLKWTGNDWEEKAFFMEQIPFDGQVIKIWGYSGNNIYCVGRNGAIYYYFGTGWQKIESGTDVDIQDIWGISDGSSNPFILCAASNVATLGEHKILRIANTEVDTINWGTGRRVHSVWFNSKEKLYACGGGVFFSSAPNYNWIEQTDVPLYFTERVRGKERNDLFVVGHYGLLAHFNGATWKTYPEASTAVIYKSLDYKNNLMVTVGLTETQAIIQFMLHN